MSNIVPPEFEQLGWPAGVASGLVWFLGPAANAVRRNLAIWSDYQSANVLKLAEKTKARTQSDDPGEVHPKVAQQVLAEASWSDDDVAQEYYAGMLIGAKSMDGEEADNAYFARLISNLSAEHLRLHHLMYSALVGLGTIGNDLRSNVSAERLQVHLPLEDLEPHLNLMRIGVAAAVLRREQLVEAFNYSLSGTPLQPLDDWVPPQGLLFTPSGLGARLFSKAHGLYDDIDPNKILDLPGVPPTLTPMPTAARATYGPLVQRPEHHPQD